MKIQTSAALIKIIGEREPFDRHLLLTRVHIHGFLRGKLGRSDLNTIVSPSLDVVLVLMRVAPITRPVDLARKLKAFGLRLHDAHRALDRIVADEAVNLALGLADRATMVPELAERGVEAQ